jgi:hypothetical protein
MKAQRWSLVLPPDGAARSVGAHVVNAFKKHIGPESCKTFDTLAFRESYKKLLKSPTDDMVVDLLNQSLAVSCFDFQATHVLSLALCPVTLFTLLLLRKHGITTVHWFYEDHRRALYWKDVLAGYDHFCAIQRGPLPDACAKAGANYHFLPTATASSGAVSPNLPRKYDIAFIGVPSRYRIAVLEKLAGHGFSLVIAGSGWKGYAGILQKMVVNNNWTDDEKSFSILSQAKIGINLSIDELADRSDVHISPRVYDVLAAGAILVTEDVPLLIESLPGCTYHTFKSTDDACSVIRTLLSGYASLTNSIGHNRQAVLRDHTYRNRVEEIVKFVS